MDVGRKNVGRLRLPVFEVFHKPEVVVVFALPDVAHGIQRMKARTVVASARPGIVAKECLLQQSTNGNMSVRTPNNEFQESRQLRMSAIVSCDGSAQSKYANLMRKNNAHPPRKRAGSEHGVGGVGHG